VAKVTGKAKYAEDFRADGMLFAKLLLSPMPHARVLRIDTSAAEALPGVKAILTVNDLPGAQAGAEIAENVRASAITERGLRENPDRVRTAALCGRSDCEPASRQCERAYDR
jgi:CO/xanthine dehydrogenase Mo-binding subunit